MSAKKQDVFVLFNCPKFTRSFLQSSSSRGKTAITKEKIITGSGVFSRDKEETERTQCSAGFQGNEPRLSQLSESHSGASPSSSETLFRNSLSQPAAVRRTLRTIACITRPRSGRDPPRRVIYCLRACQFPGREQGDNILRSSAPILLTPPQRESRGITAVHARRLFRTIPRRRAQQRSCCRVLGPRTAAHTRSRSATARAFLCYCRPRLPHYVLFVRFAVM